MLIPFPHQNSSDHLLMAGLSLGILGALLLGICFFPDGLHWWLVQDWTASAKWLCLFSFLALCVLPVGVLFTVFLRMVGDSIVFLVPIFICFPTFVVMAMIVASSVDNIGPLSLYRADEVRTSLAIQETRMASLPRGEKVSAAAMEDLLVFQEAMEEKTHRAIRLAYERRKDAIDGEPLTNALNAAALLGLSDHPSVQAARQRGWMHPEELEDLRNAARASTSRGGKASKFSSLQSAAFLTLTERHGLDRNIDWDPPTEKAK